MIDPKLLSVEKMVGFTHFGTVALNASGTAILIAFHRSANSSPLAFLALPPDDAKAHAADILRMVIAVQNGLSPEDRLAFVPDLVEWHPSSEPPNTNRIVLISNEQWLEEDKVWLGYFEEDAWAAADGAWLDSEPDSGAADAEPTHWAEVPRPRAKKGGPRP